MVTRQEFLKDVRHEIDMLKLHATVQEKEGLNFETFDPKHTELCIYGQMTGSCKSIRAKELMDKSCKRMMNINDDKVDISELSIDTMLPEVNGDYNGFTWEMIDYGKLGKNYFRNFKYLSSLEGYICATNAKNKKIIAYIKGETDTLEL